MNQLKIKKIKEDTAELIECNSVLTIFVYLYAFKVKICTCPVNHLPTVLSLELNSHIPKTNIHFTPQRLICSLGDLTMSTSLTQLVYWNEIVQLSLVKVKVNFTLEQAKKAHRESAGISVLFL